MTETKPLFSIIVVTFNAENSIEKTITSIRKQNFPDYEILIKDAESKDNTLKKIPKDEKIKVISCKDSGIYDGMNQAIELASGKYIIFMNSGDNFHSDDVLFELNRFLTEHYDMIYGNWYRDGQLFVSPTVLSASYLFRHPLCHQAICYDRETILNCGKYNLSYKMCADYDLNLRLFFLNSHIGHIDIPICDYEGGGTSEEKKNKKMVSKEFKQIRKMNYPNGIYIIEGIKWRLTFPRLRIFMIERSKNTIINKMYYYIQNKWNT